MTTATPTTKRNSTAELPQTGDRRWNGPLDREDPKIDERARLPGRQSAEAEAGSEQESFVNMIAKTFVALHDWLSGPPMTARDRVRHDNAEHPILPLYGPIGGA